jgi:uncharacterized protein YecE (DUF72 family)
MARIYAGTSGWAYPSWKPDFYPAKLSSAKFLAYYAGRLNSVELNYTFRRMPTPKLLAGWVAATPADFKFAVKAHQNITHVKRLRDVAEWTTQFISSLEPLAQAGKLGPVLFQLPPFLKCDVPRLANFLAALPRGTRAAFEFRHASWFCNEVFEALRGANAALCQAESETLESPDVQTADFVYFRLRKESYSAESRGALASRIRRIAAGADVFTYFKHEETAEGAMYAETLLAQAQIDTPEISNAARPSL